MTAATDKQWRVQVRKSRAHKWVNKGLFETRASARANCLDLRDGFFDSPGYGEGQTRVIPYVKAKKAVK